ncbi:MAG: 30S ribosomal protein S20 [Spirochaetes bacterium]|nr:30S ribosomal protein S20 [Spirochaetota bacterium]
MAHIRSQIKRNRQNEKRREKNSRVKSSIRTATKKVLKAVEVDANPDAASESYAKLVKIIDTAAGAGIVHKNAAARKKSRLAKKLNALHVKDSAPSQEQPQ